MITIKQAETTIAKLNVDFDTHDFIIQFTKDFEREYVEMLDTVSKSVSENRKSS